jgi:hypothetical protein
VPPKCYLRNVLLDKDNVSWQGPTMVQMCYWNCDRLMQNLDHDVPRLTQHCLDSFFKVAPACACMSTCLVACLSMSFCSSCVRVCVRACVRARVCVCVCVACCLGCYPHRGQFHVAASGRVHTHHASRRNAHAHEHQNVQPRKADIRVRPMVGRLSPHLDSHRRQRPEVLSFDGARLVSVGFCSLVLFVSWLSFTLSSPVFD